MLAIRWVMMNVRAARALGSLLVVSALLAGCGGGTADRDGDGTAAPAASNQTSTGTPAAAAPSAEPTQPAGDPVILLLTATGTARVQSLTYEVGDEKGTETSAKLPWRKTFTLYAGDEPQNWKLVINHSDGDVRAIARINGRVVTQGAGGGTGTGTVTLSGRISG